MQFDFNVQPKAQNYIDIDNIGEFCLDASSDEGIHYVIMVQSFYGKSLIATSGPFVPDIELLPSSYEIKLKEQDFNDGQICKIIDRFLNDPYKKITSAYLVDQDYALEQFRNVSEYLRNYKTTGGYHD